MERFGLLAKLDFEDTCIYSRVVEQPTGLAPRFIKRQSRMQNSTYFGGSNRFVYRRNSKDK